MSQRPYRNPYIVHKSNTPKMITLDISSALDGINPEKVAKAIKE